MQQQQPQQPQYTQQYPPNQYAPQPQYPIQQVPAGYPQQPPVPVSHRSFMKDALVFGIAGIAALYLMWPSIIPDFVPDMLPIIGQLDDDTAVLVILSCFRYFGLDLTNIFMGFQRLRGQQQPPQKQ